MRINTQEVVTQIKGEPYKDAQGESLTVGDVIIDALTVAKVGGKMKIYKLINEIATTDSVELDATDVVMIQNAVEGSNFNNIVCGQVLSKLA